MDIAGMRAQIPSLQRTIYLNTGTEGPTPRCVLETHIRVASEIAEQGPAAVPMQRYADRMATECRTAVAAYIGADPDEIAITHNASEGIGMVAAGMDWQPGDEVIISDLEHASGILPWLNIAQRKGVQVVRLESTRGSLGAMDFAAAFTPRTRLVCMSHVSYASGARLPVAEVTKSAHEHGIRVVVDGAQAVGQIAVDVHALGCDFYSLPGQKWMLGPAGTGALYVRRDALHALSVTHVGWASVANDSPGEPLRFHPGARRFEVATMHAPSLASWHAAMDWTTGLGIQAIEARIAQLAHTARAQLASVPDLEVLGPDEPALWTGLLPFRVAHHDPKDIVERLWREAHVISRWIAQPYCVRLSLHAFTTEEEVERVAHILR